MFYVGAIVLCKRKCSWANYFLFIFTDSVDMPIGCVFLFKGL